LYQNNERLVKMLLTIRKTKTPAGYLGQSQS